MRLNATKHHNYCRNCREYWTSWEPERDEHLNCPVCHSNNVELARFLAASRTPYS